MMAATMRDTSRTHNTFSKSLLLVIFAVLLCGVNSEQKRRYASAVECDRHSLDAVYYEKFKPITDNIFADSKEFVSRVCDLVADSLTTVMAELPDRDTSSEEEKKVYTQFKNVKDIFSSKVKKAHRNITESWESLVMSNFDLLFDNGKCTLEKYLDKTHNLTDAYLVGRLTLDKNLNEVVGFIKGTIKDGIKGISAAAEDAIKREAQKLKENSTAEQKVEEKEDPKEKLKKKKIEITEMIVPGFLGKLTVEVIKRDLDLEKEITIKPEDRDSVLDDMQFDILMIRNRMRAIINTDFPKDKGSIDLARRSIYTYWADMADEMYKEKIKAKEATPGDAETYYKKLWNNEDELANTLLNLMEVYK